MYQPNIENTFLGSVVLRNNTIGHTDNFENIPVLNDPRVRIVGISAYSATQLTRTPTGNAVIAAADVPGIVVTLVEAELERVSFYPYYELIAALNGGAIRQFRGLKLNLTKSQITVVNTGTLSANQALAFSFIFKYV